MWGENFIAVSTQGMMTLHPLTQWNNVLRFEYKKLSDLEIYKISITHNLKDNNFNTYLYLRGESS